MNNKRLCQCCYSLLFLTQESNDATYVSIFSRNRSNYINQKKNAKGKKNNFKNIEPILSLRQAFQLGTSNRMIL